MQLNKLVWSAVNADGYFHAGNRTTTIAWGLPSETLADFQRLIRSLDGFPLNTVRIHSAEAVDYTPGEWFECALLTASLRAALYPR